MQVIHMEKQGKRFTKEFKEQIASLYNMGKTVHIQKLFIDGLKNIILLKMAKLVRKNTKR